MRTWRNAAALVGAVGGVRLLTDVHLAASPLGLGLAAANAALFAVHIILGHRLARTPHLSGIDALALAMIVAAVAALPVGIDDARPAHTDLGLLAAAVGVGVSSSVIPHVCDQLAMRRLSRGAYALMTSLLPATTTVIGVVVLAQVPSVPEILGVALVVLGVALHRTPVTPPPQPPESPETRAHADHEDVHARDSAPRP